MKPSLIEDLLARAMDLLLPLALTAAGVLWMVRLWQLGH